MGSPSIYDQSGEMAGSSSNGNSGAHIPRPRFWLQTPTFATLFVGAKKERFAVHEALLVCYSRFFRAALTGKSKEAEEKAITLEGDHVETVEFFVHWLYHQQLPDKMPTEYPEILEKWMKDDDCGARKIEQLVRLYIFCDKYDIPKLMRA
ncbi:hypothetical protein K491DRAFT_715052 [Lophiostoma macrostomum CBS 122681]|uniref:BTB domain-containing protein n=1 Tax=Lophiostoma macrostomum CBS 122681 TaxID=1314788 RepID=A0A6A6TD45_9PLEO|nr:hypothetical protein K491DRAFT_715052 [Lophiostoma macrostomum CBS 122681]